MRLTLKALQEAGGVKELKKMLKRIDSVSDPRIRGFTRKVFDCSKYACIYTLTSHAGKHMIGDSFYITLVTVMVIYYLAAMTEIFGHKFNRSLGIFNKEPLLMFLAELMTRNCEIVQMTGLRDGDPNGGMKHDVLVAPFTALSNHSCCPNMIYFGNNKTIAIALQPIKEGEQIWDNYLGLHYSRVPKSQRQHLLKRDYLFTCDCVACVKNWPMLEQLPHVTEIPGLSPTAQKEIFEAQKAYLLKTTLSIMEGNLMNSKEEIANLLEVLHEYAFPSKEMIDYQEHLKKMCAGGIDLF